MEFQDPKEIHFIRKNGMLPAKIRHVSGDRKAQSFQNLVQTAELAVFLSFGYQYLSDGKPDTDG